MHIAKFVSQFLLFAISPEKIGRMPLQSGLKKVFLLFFILLFSQLITAQETISTIKKPKIGLVLSGGGAKGLAHIGVLKELEKAGIKIDYIGGTSMGAIVGGLYASGYSAHQLDSIFTNTNYDAVIQDYTPRTSKNFYEKRNDELYALSLPFTKFKLGIPAALSKGLYNYNLINRLLFHVRNQRDFSKLPIPFVCIATDIENGKPVILNKGYLPQALVASGAFPSLYAPVELEDKYLIDGGVLNNYPIEEVKKMGADIIIGVDVQDDLKDRKSLQEATRILVQISNLQMIQKMQEYKKITDIYIKPEVGNFSVISFEEGVNIIKKGEEATQKVIDQIKPLGNYHKVIPLKTVYKEKDSLSIYAIETPKLQNYTRSYLIGKLRFKSGSKITFSDLQSGIENLNATQNFSAISYEIEERKEGNILILKVKESNVKTLLKAGIHYDGLYKSAALLNITQKKLLVVNDVLSLDIILGDNFRYNFDYYIDNGFYLSYGIRSRLNQFNRNVGTDFSNGSIFNEFNINTLNINFSDFTNQLYCQTLFMQKFLLGGGFEHKHIRIKSETIENRGKFIENSDYLSVFGYLKFDSFDNKYFPKKGLLASGDVQSIFYSSNFTNSFTKFSIMKGEVSYAKTFYKKFTVVLESEAGFAIGEPTVPFLDFVLGGYGFGMINNFRHFYGYDFVSLAGNSYIKGAASLNYEIFKKNHINFTANYANIGNDIFENNRNWLTKPSFSGYAFGYGLETVLGPVEVKHSWSPETRDHFTWISVGFWF